MSCVIKLLFSFIFIQPWVVTVNGNKILDASTQVLKFAYWLKTISFFLASFL